MNDDFFKKALEGIEPPFEPNDWEAMSQQLDEQERTAKRLGTYKAIEIGLMLVLVATLWQLVPSSGTKHIPTRPSQTAPVQPTGPTQEMIRQFEEESKLPPAPPPKVENKKRLAEAMPKDENTFKHTPKALASVENIVSRTEIGGTASADTHPAPQAAANLPTVATAMLRLPPKSSEIEVNSLPKKQLLLPQPEATLALALPNLSSPKKRKSLLRLGMKFGAENNFIITPSNDNNKSKKWDNYLGYTSGITLGFNHGKYEITTGLSHTFISYPSIYTPSEVPDDVELNDIEYNLLSVPVTFAFDLKDIGRSKIYAKVGASLNMNLESNYDYASRTNLKYKSDEGLLKEGKFFDNSFISGEIGLGIERKMNERIMVFVEPTYRRPLFGVKLGPNNNNITTASLNLGAKVSL